MNTTEKKYAVVTGATKGIGFATSVALAKDNYNLVLCARNEANLATTQQEIAYINPKITIHTFKIDVAERQEIQSLITSVFEKFPHLNVLVNNAGIFIPGKITDEADGAFEKIMDTNVYSVYHLTRGLLPLLKKADRAHIFNLGSVAGTRAYNNGGSYSVSKFALDGLSQNLREELKPHNIKVTTVIAGATWSASWEGFEAPIERLMQADDLAQMMVATLHLSNAAVVENIVMRPQLGDL